jgi:hypothetical protein
MAIHHILDGSHAWRSTTSSTTVVMYIVTPPEPPAHKAYPRPQHPRSAQAQLEFLELQHADGGHATVHPARKRGDICGQRSAVQ